MHLPKAIAALPKWADTEASRYQLECVRIKADGRLVFAEATDGRRLCRLTWHCTGVEGEYYLDRKALSKALKTVGLSDGGYSAGLNGAVTLYGRNAGQTIPKEEVERWPKTEDVLVPAASARRDTIDTYWLRDKARAVLKADPKATPPAMDLQVGPVTMRMDATYLRDMAETAIQCGYDEVQVTATDPQSAVHFWCNNDVLFDAVIMPLAQD
jgi:hypothetical protein